MNRHFHPRQIPTSSDCSLVSFKTAVIWSNIHVTTAIICACRPTYKMVLGKAVSFARHVLHGYREAVNTTAQLMNAGKYRHMNHIGYKIDQNIDKRRARPRNPDDSIMADTTVDVV